ncbi:hypothetical protein JCM24511_01420 [Saitozyma sp. JCM 24511]|nr:hypothetical protein JCM24511_01420 [Saitozyma sp. JCM 24511]
MSLSGPPGSPRKHYEMPRRQPNDGAAPRHASASGAAHRDELVSKASPLGRGRAHRLASLRLASASSPP